MIDHTKLTILFCLVFTQFVDTGAILGRMLCEEGIRFVQFWGELTMKQKDRAIETFFEIPEVKVMVSTARVEGLSAKHDTH